MAPHGSTPEQAQLEADALALRSQSKLASDLLAASAVEIAHSSLGDLPPAFKALDASRPWIIYWSLHSLALLGSHASADDVANAMRTLLRCQRHRSGFAGSPLQEPHLATTYAACASLATLGDPSALRQVDRDGVRAFVRARFDEAGNGGFALTPCGEVDPRGAYCALAACTLLRLDIADVLGNENIEQLGSYLASCQTYEGGIGPAPGVEAHGGYSYCGLAAAVLCNQHHKLDIMALAEWVSMRQGDSEGGFAGRTSKLADACYAFWQAATLEVARTYCFRWITGTEQCVDDSDGKGTQRWFDEEALQEWLLKCCQDTNGGFRDKPGKERDLYHTCYGLSGLALTSSNEVNGTDLLLNVEHSCLAHFWSEELACEK